MKMSRSMFILPVVGAGMLVSGCAGIKTPDEGVVRHQIDRQYVAAMERSARGSGIPVKIIWVNPPEKRVEDDGESSYTLELPDNKD